MQHPVVRIKRLSLNNIKSVTFGNIEFKAVNALHKERADILGIYGQNGSGKTVVIEVLAILKSILSGQQIQSRYLESITIGEKSGRLELELSITDTENTDCTVIYNCKLEQRENPNESSLNNGAEMKNRTKLFLAVTDESLKISGFFNGKKYPKQYIAQTDETQKLIQPEQKRKLLFGNDEKILKKLEHQKILALYGSRSFIFSNQSVEAIWNNCRSDYKFIINSIRFFAITRLFIVGGEIQNETPLPFNFVVESEESGICGQIPFSMESKAILSEEMMSVFKSFVNPLNIVLSSIIPGLEIVYRSQKASLDEKNSFYEIELFAVRDQIYKFPMRHESLGVKKLISFLSLLIAAYNDKSVILAVDEFDSSIFEFLLGELMSIFKNSGKGQLVFTSHNLRPLEKLDATSICFTTTDPQNRYIKLKKKTTNNLRDMYFRMISLGNKDFELYSSESKNAIAFAFRQAGWEE